MNFFYIFEKIWKNFYFWKMNSKLRISDVFVTKFLLPSDRTNSKFYDFMSFEFLSQSVFSKIEKILKKFKSTQKN